MLSLRTALVTTLTATAVIGATVAPSASAQDAAAPAGCPEDNVCLYDGPGYTGAWNRRGCDRKSVPFVDAGSSAGQRFKALFSNSDRTNTDRQDAKFLRRVDSVYNRCGHTWILSGSIADGSVSSQVQVNPSEHIPDLGAARNTNTWLTDPARVPFVTPST